MPRPIAVSTDETYPYVLESNRDDAPDDRVTWHLRPLSRKDKEKLGNMLTADSEGNALIMLGSRSWFAVERGLVRVENFRDAHGNEIEVEFTDHKRTALKDSFLDRLPKPVVDELAMVIQNGADLTPDEEKKPEPSRT